MKDRSRGESLADAIRTMLHGDVEEEDMGALEESRPPSPGHMRARSRWEEEDLDDRPSLTFLRDQ